MRSLLSLVGVVAMVYGLLCAWMFFTQRSQIYFPTPESRHPQAQALWLDVDAARLKVWTVARPGPKALLYFGGNAEDVAGSVDRLAETLPARSLFLVNYRGYGGSSGRPSEMALVTDAIALFDSVQASHPDIAVMGRSLGAAVAVQLAAARPVERLVLVTPFDSLVDVARTYFGWLPVGLLLKDRYESAQRAPAVSAQVLVVVAADDEIIPTARSEALVAAFAPGQAVVAVVPDAGHNSLDQSPRYLQSVAAFLAESTRTPRSRE